MASYVPFVPMAGLLVIGAWLWLKVDPAEELVSGMHAVTQTVALPAQVK